MTALETARLDIVEDKVDTMNTKIDRILTALIGDDLNLDRGLISEHKDMRDRIFKLEALKNKVIWMAVGAGVAGGVSIVKIIDYLKASGQ